MKFIAAGDCGADRYLNLKAERAGGISLNVAVNARLAFPKEAEIGVVTVLGRDSQARLVDEALRRFGVTGHVASIEGDTPVQHIDIEVSGEKNFVRYEAGVLGDYRIGSDEQRVLKDADVVVVAWFDQIRGFVDSVMAAAVGGLRAMDFGPAQSLDPLRRYLPGLDIAFFGLTPDSGELIEAVRQEALRTGKLFVITLGEHGSVAFHGRVRHDCRSVAVAEMVDSTGAGDSFVAGFFSAFAFCNDVGSALRCGSQIAARSVQRIGAFDAPLVGYTD